MHLLSGWIIQHLNIMDCQMHFLFASAILPFMVTFSSRPADLHVPYLEEGRTINEIQKPSAAVMCDYCQRVKHKDCGLKC